MTGCQPVRQALKLVPLVVISGILYGAVMGSFGGIWGERFLQLLYSSAKVPVLLMSMFLLSLPSFYVVNTLMGLRQDFAHAVRALVATQAGLAIIFASFAPFTLLWYAPSSNYRAAILFNGAMFAAASLGAQWLLRRFYRPLVQRDARHRLMMRAWLVIYSVRGQAGDGDVILSRSGLGRCLCPDCTAGLESRGRLRKSALQPF